MTQVSGGSITPSVGASSGAGGQGDTNSGGIDYAATSDDQILDLDTDAADDLGDDGDQGDGDGGAGDLDQDGESDELNLDGEEGDEDEGQGQDDEDEQGDEDGEGDDQQDQTTQNRVVPPQFKELFKKHPELKDAYLSERAFRAVMPTVTEAREYKQLAPTIEDLRVAVDNSAQLADLDGMFYSTDPATKVALIERMNTEDPAAFRVLAQEFGRAVHRLDPELYSEQVAEPIVVSTLQNMMQRAISEGAETPAGKNLIAAVEVLSRRLFGVPVAQLGQRQPARNQQRDDPERQRFNQERTQFDNDRYEQFHEGTNTRIVASVNRLIGDALTAATKGTALATRPKALERIKAEAFQKLDANLRSNRGLTELLRKELTSARRTGKYPPELARKIEGLMVGKAKGSVSKVVASVVTEWTKDLLAENGRQVNTARRSAARTEAGNGRAASGGGNKAGATQGRPSAKDIDYGRTSDDDILSGKAYRRKK